jgi:hypothetical protein
MENYDKKETINIYFANQSCMASLEIKGCQRLLVATLILDCC